MCDRQIANIDISKEYDESLGSRRCALSVVRPHGGIFGRHMLPHRHEQYLSDAFPQ